MAGIIERIMGGGRKAKAPASPAEALAAADAAVARHTAELTAAREEIAGAERARKALLVRDGTDDDIADIEQRIAGAKLRIERLDELRAPLAAKLADARDAVREARFLDLKAAYWPAAERWLEHARGARAAIDEMNTLRAEALNANLRAEAAAFFHPASVQLSDELIRQFDRSITRSREVANGVSPPPKAKPVEPTVSVRWRRDPEQKLGPSGRFGPPRAGWVGSIAAVAPDIAAALVAAGDAEIVGSPPIEVAPNPGAFAPVTSPAPAAVEPAKAESAPPAPAPVEQSTPSRAPGEKMDRSAWEARTMRLNEREDSR